MYIIPFIGNEKLPEVHGKIRTRDSSAIPVPLVRGIAPKTPAKTPVHEKVMYLYDFTLLFHV